MDLNKLALDLDKEAKGVWEDLDSETSILVARMFNPNFNRMFEEMTAPHRRAAKNGLLSEEVAENILVTCLASTILLGWKGLKENGVEIPYSHEKAKAILTDKRLKAFRQMVVEIAENHARFREEEIADTAGKSGTSSAGTSSGASTKSS